MTRDDPVKGLGSQVLDGVSRDPAARVSGIFPHCAQAEYCCRGDRHFDSKMRTDHMEVWDLYTENRIKTGREHIRGAQIPEGYYHLVVHVWIRNKQGAYLISQRAANRPTYPLMWECVGGSVLKGEESVNGAIREAKEEVGIDLMPSQGKLLFSNIRNPFHDMVDVWLFEYDGDIQIEKATTDEVADCKWMSVDEIKKLHDSGKLVHTLDYFFCACKDDIPVNSHGIGTPGLI